MIRNSHAPVSVARGSSDELPHEVMLHYFLYCLDLKTGAIQWKQEFYVVPTIAANDAVPLVFTLGGVAVPQSLALAVGTR